MCSPIPWNTETPLGNTTMTYMSLRVSSSHAQLSPNHLSLRDYGDQLSSLLEPDHQHRRIASCCPSSRKVFPFTAPCWRQWSSRPSYHPLSPPQQCHHLPRTLRWPQTSSSRNRRLKNCNCPWQSACVETDHKMTRRLTSSCLSWSSSARLDWPHYRCCCCLACQPVDSNDVFCWSGLLWSACSDLFTRAPWYLLASTSFEHQCTSMDVECFSGDFIAERFRPDVRKIVLVLDTTDSPPLRFDFILQPQMRHVDVFHVDEECVLLFFRQWSISASLANPSHTSCSGCPSSWRSQCCCIQFCFCTASDDDLLFSCMRFRTLSSHERDPRAWRFPRFFVSSPVWVRENCPFWTHVPEFDNLNPLSLSLQVPDESLQFGKAVLRRIWHSLLQLVHDECYVCSVLTEVQASGHMSSVLADLFWVSPHWILVFHIVNYWSLHCVSVLELQTLNENVNVSRIVLIQYPCFSPASLKFSFSCCGTEF